ncbi:6303_t:CDS:1, partial [Gigaspora rosea]
PSLSANSIKTFTWKLSTLSTDEPPNVNREFLVRWKKNLHENETMRFIHVHISFNPLVKNLKE